MTRAGPHDYQRNTTLYQGEHILGLLKSISTQNGVKLRICTNIWLPSYIFQWLSSLALLYYGEEKRALTCTTVCRPREPLGNRKIATMSLSRTLFAALISSSVDLTSGG
jgi:hypothetical protein